MTRAGRSTATRSLLAVMATVATMAAGATMTACTAPLPVSVDFSETPRDYQSKDYTDVYTRWTRHGLARLDVDAALEAWVTFKGWDFREAYVEHYSTVYSLNDADKAALRTAQLEASRNAYEFHVTAQSSNYKWNDLEKRNSPWRITLVDGLGHELAPESIRLEKLPDPYEVEFFPAKGPFTRTYAIRFLRVGTDGKPVDFPGPSTGSIMLRITSPVGRVELIWQNSS
jgi:hypothetical protein